MPDVLRIIVEESLRPCLIPADFTRIGIGDRDARPARSVLRDHKTIVCSPAQRHGDPERPAAIRFHRSGLSIPTVEIAGHVRGGLLGRGQKEGDGAGLLIIANAPLRGSCKGAEPRAKSMGRSSMIKGSFAPVR